MFKLLQEFLAFNKNDIRGSLVLMFLIILINLAPNFYRHYFPKKPSCSKDLMEARLKYDELICQQEAWNNKTDDFPNKYDLPNTVSNAKNKEFDLESLSFIDPNKIQKRELQQLGISHRTISRWNKYLSAGGKFYKKEDIKKIYGITDEELSQLQKPLGAWELANKNERLNKAWKTDNKSQSNSSLSSKKDSVFYFNPNLIPDSLIDRLAISSKARKSWKSYRKAGGKFQDQEDLSKLFGMDSLALERLKNYVELPTAAKAIASADSSKFRQFDGEEKFKDYQKANPIDVNLAKVNDWKSLKGIGAYYANAIVRYRTELGGFISLDQIAEVPGMRPETITLIRPYIFLESFINKKININTATKTILEKHPYINSKQANVIYKYRRKHGEFTDLKDLLKIYLLDKEWLDKISPYLSLSTESSHALPTDKRAPTIFQGSRTGP